MAITLTDERLIEVAPRTEWWKELKRKELAALAGLYSAQFVMDPVWNVLILWYWHEAKEIGEYRAFWGLVYRIVDDPTDEDLTIIATKIDEYEREVNKLFTEFYDHDPSKEPETARLLERVDRVFPSDPG
jgi:hypothetical protein